MEDDSTRREMREWETKRRTQHKRYEKMKDGGTENRTREGRPKTNMTEWETWRIIQHIQRGGNGRYKKEAPTCRDLRRKDMEKYPTQTDERLGNKRKTHQKKIGDGRQSRTQNVDR